MQVTVYRGTKEVGGTCIEISTNDSRVVLDIGLPLFDEDREPLDSFQLRRMTKDELLTKGILPRVPGLFDGSPSPDAILLSHSHLDHTGLLAHSKPHIPVYASRGTSKMMLAGGIFAGQINLPRDRFREVKPGQTFEIGGLVGTGLNVDHSTFGCMAYLIEADGKSVLYTGDVRTHGRKPGMMKRLIELMSGRQVDVMLMEGTHFGLPDGNTIDEYELERRIVEHVSKAPGLVLASFSPQDVDRLVTFIRAAKKTYRVFVADVYTAFVLHLIASEIPIPVAEKDGLVRVYYPKAFTESVDRRGLQDLADRFETSRISLKEIKSNPSKYLMIFRPSMLDSDFDGKFPDATTCLYSRWSGYLEKSDWQQTKSKIEEAAGELIKVHTSGHILSSDIIPFVKGIAPRLVVPVHTFQPQDFGKHLDNVRLIADGETFTV